MQILQVVNVAVAEVYNSISPTVNLHWAKLHCAEASDCTCLVNEEVPAVFWSVDHTSLLDLASDTVAECVLVFSSAQVSNVASRQQVIDIHQELLIHNLVVSHEEGDGNALNTSLGVQGQQVFLKICHTVG